MELMEKNYDIHDEELLAVVEVFQHWWPYCHEACFPIRVFTDDQNPRYFPILKILNQHQVHWAGKRFLIWLSDCLPSRFQEQKARYP
jgi:hypothetical protein